MRLTSSWLAHTSCSRISAVASLPAQPVVPGRPPGVLFSGEGSDERLVEVARIAFLLRGVASRVAPLSLPVAN